MVKLSCLFLILSFFVASANGEVVWDWEILNPVITANPTENITVYGMLFNDVNSETLRNLDGSPPAHPVGIFLLLLFGPHFGGNKNLSIAENYDLDGPAFQEQFSGVVIEPGESYGFELFTLVPKAIGANYGGYENIESTISIFFSSVGSIDGETITIAVVPLPAVGLGLAPIMVITVVFSHRNRSNKKLNWTRKKQRAMSCVVFGNGHCEASTGRL